MRIAEFCLMFKLGKFDKHKRCHDKRKRRRCFLFASESTNLSYFVSGILLYQEERNFLQSKILLTSITYFRTVCDL